MRPGDLHAVVSIWNRCSEAGETVYAPLTDAVFHQKFIGNPNYMPEYALVAEEAGRVIGFIHGITKRVFLPKETHANTPGYITCVFADAAYRRQGVGSALLNALTATFKRNGKTSAACRDTNPVNLDWIIPGTPGHDHNNAPGVDIACMGHPFLQKHGFQERYREVAMYLHLADYQPASALDDIRRKLREEGISTGRYDVSLGYDFSRMCDRVGSEYWRKVLQDETSKPYPRPILAATYGTHIVGFTGPVDKQPSGRGWFTGICTDPEYEKRCIATVLFNLLMQEFIAAGASFSTLFTGDTNHAQRIYAKTGFRAARRFAAMDRDL
jgi:GNAT superfamily N-acetyltransferase